VVDTVHGLPAIGYPQFSLEVTGNGVARQVSLGAPDCLPVRHAVPAGDQIVVADAVSGTLIAIARNGEKQTLYQAGEPPRVHQALLDSISVRIDLTERFYGGSATAESKRAIFEQVGPVGGPVPSVWRQFLIDTSGRFWLRRATRCWSPADEASIWDIVDQNNESLGSLRVPGNLRILDITDDEILAVETDALGVEWVSVYGFNTSTPTQRR
jgi:hypothetical protein